MRDKAMNCDTRASFLPYTNVEAWYHLKKNKKTMIHLKTACVVMMCCITTVMSASTCSATPAKGSKKPEKKEIIAVPDSVVVSMIGEDAAAVIFTAKKATLFIMRPTVKPKDQDKTIGGVLVGKQVRKLNRSEQYLFQFMLADSLSYTDVPIVPTTPYLPTVAIEFESKYGICQLLFSLTSQEVGIVVNGQEVTVLRYRNARLITRFFAENINEKFYNDILKLLQ